MLEERRVGPAGRLEVAEERVGARQQVGRDDDPDPPVVEDDADETEELRDEERVRVDEPTLRRTSMTRGESGDCRLPSSRLPLIASSRCP